MSIEVAPAGTQIPWVKYKPLEVAEHYNFPDNAGEGMTIGILAWWPENAAGVDVQVIQNQVYKIVGSKPNLNVVLLGNQTNNTSNISGEATMDSTITGTYLYNADSINIYIAPADKPHLTLEQAISDNCSVTTCSFGIHNSAYTAAFDSALQSAAGAGITTCFASGDSGAASGGSVDAVAYPAGSPYALAVGGTFIPVSTDAEEVWWNYPPPNSNGSRSWWASGGGVSKNYSVPQYQSTVNPTSFQVNGITYTGRGVPDVAVFAEGNNGWFGTSAASPTFASLIARINSELVAAGGSNVGDIHDNIYNPPQGFFPLTSINTGNNIPPKNSGFPQSGYTAENGWDACTGLGIPDGSQLLSMFKKIQGL